MIPGISTFTNLPTPIKVGLLVVSGGGIMAVIRYILPPRLRWVVFIGIAVVALLLLLYWRLLKWLKKRKAAPMERGLIENTSATPQVVSEAAHMARLDDLRKKFEEGIEKFQAAGKSLYSFPWYIIVGEPGSGKTEAIRHCNVGFPAGLQDQFQGAGGTVNMNWWFTDHAVIIDTAGRLMFEEVETGGSSEWKEFLNLLKKYRPSCPINGVFLVIPADSLIKDTADEIEQKASKIARQFDVIQRALDVRFPVFVVITKGDLINGFRDFFDNLDDPQLQHQILGWSNPSSLDEPYNPDFIGQHLKAIQGRLFRRRLALMQEIISDEPGVEKMRTADTLYAFPQSLTKMAPRMARYLELIFSVGSQWSCKPLFFRGIYFTSSMREGSALDEDLAESLGVPIDSLPDGRVWERDRAYFLRDLFMKKVFREQGLVTYATNANKQHSRRKTTVLLSAAASVILLLLFTFYAAHRFDKSIGEMKKYLEAAATLIEAPQLNELKVIKYKDGYKYIGRAGIHVSRGKDVEKLDIERFEFYAQLADTVDQWEKKGVPWIFAPAAKFAKGIKSEKLNEAQAVVYEMGVLQPFIDAASNIMNTQKNGEWIHENPETNTLRQLICIKAGKPLDKEGKYTAQAFLNPFFGYVFKRDEDFESQIQMYREDRDKLHQPLGMIYGEGDDKGKPQGAWPPVSLKTDPNSPDTAIEHGINLFIEYWNDPDRIGARRQDNAQVETIKKLKDALEKFNAAEERILSLGDGFEPKSAEPYVVEQCEKFVSEWNESFISLNEARENIYNYSSTLKSTQSLGDLWIEVANNLLRDVEENYHFLLNELKEVKKEGFLGGIRDKLNAALTGMRSKLKDSEFEERLRLLNERFYTQVQDGSRLYQIRFQMYKKADEQLAVTEHISGVNQVAEAIRKVNKAVRNARREIDESLYLDPAAFRFQKAADISKFALSLAEQRHLYDIVKGGLKVAPKNIEELENLIEKEAKEDLEVIIPAEIIERKYDPTATAATLGGWKFLGDTLKKRLLPEETRLNEIYEDANGVYSRYTELYVDYWLDKVPEYVIKSKVRRDWQRFKSLMIRNVFNELVDELGEPLERVLTELDEYISYSGEEVKQFQDNLDKVRDRHKYEKIYDECRAVLNNWRKLSDDVFEARRTLLSMQPADFREDYVPFSYESPAEFVDMYWTELTQGLLRLTADQAQREETKVLNELIRYGDRFPLERYSEVDLTQDEFIESHALLSKIRPQKDLDSKTIGGGAEIGFDKVDEQISRLRGLSLSKSDEKWVEGVKQVFRGLPEGEDPYYCKIILLNEKKQRSLLRDGEDLLLDYLTEFRLVQGKHKSERFNTRLREDLNVGTVKYPGPPISIEFYQYPSDIEPRTSLGFSGPWACLRMLHQCYYEGKKGYIRLNVKDKERLGLVLYLQLEFCRDSDGKYNVDLPRPKQWPSLKSKY